MNIILLIAVTFTLALVRGQNSKPCMKGKDTGFVKKHIIPKDLKEDKAQWSTWVKKLLPSALPDLARETSKQGYENKPKTRNFSGRGKKKQ